MSRGRGGRGRGSKNTQTQDDGQFQLVTISELGSFNNLWTIKARVVGKSQIRTFNSAKGEGKFFSVDLVDSTGEIKCTCFNDAVDLFENVFEVNSVYFISKGSVKPGNPKFTKHDYEMTLSKSSVVKKCEDDSVDKLPRQLYKFVDIDMIQDLDVNTIIDIKGILSDVRDCVVITTKSNSNLTKRDVVIADTTFRTIEMTIWGEKAEAFIANPGDVILVKNVKVTEFQGKKLSLLPSSMVELNPKIPLAEELSTWWSINSHKIAATPSYSSSASQPPNQNNITTLKNIQDEVASTNKPVTKTSIFTIMYIRHDEKTPLFYKSVPGGIRKVVENTTGGDKPWYCKGTDEYYDTHDCRYIVQMAGSDYSASCYMTAFDDGGKAIMGCEAKEINELRNRGEEAELHRLVQEVLYQRVVAKISAKEEIYDSESRIKYGIQSVSPVNYSQQSKILLEKIKSFQ